MAMELTDREQNIVFAAIRLWNVNARNGFVPDYELHNGSFGLPPDAMREVRDLVQEIRPGQVVNGRGAS
jgi:hypothetical protein